MTTVITPTAGRMVWFYENNEQKEPLAAIVAKVNDDRNINVCAFTEMGNPFPVEGLPLVQEGDERPVHRHATWMPYQLGQAKKTADGGK